MTKNSQPKVEGWLALFTWLLFIFGVCEVIVTGFTSIIPPPTMYTYFGGGVFQIVIFILVYRHSRFTRVVAISYFLASIGVEIVLNLTNPTDIEFVNELVALFLFMYFSLSKRVKSTFPPLAEPRRNDTPEQTKDTSRWEP